jgi:hypothetical protein
MAFAGFNPYSGNQQDYLPWMSNVEQGIRGGHQWGPSQSQALVGSFGGVEPAANVMAQIGGLQQEVGSQQDIANRYWGNVQSGRPAQAGLGWGDLAGGVQGQVRTMFPESYGWDMDTRQKYFSSPGAGADNPGGLPPMTPWANQGPSLAAVTNPQMQGMVSKFQDLIRDDPSQFYGGNNVWLNPNDLSTTGSSQGLAMSELPDLYSRELDALLKEAYATHPSNPSYTAPPALLDLQNTLVPTQQLDPGLLDLQKTLVPAQQTDPGLLNLQNTQVLSAMHGGEVDADPVTGQPIIGNLAATGERPENADVYDFQMPDNPLMPQVQEGQQQILDMLMEGGQLPYVEALMAAQRDEQQRARQDQEQALVMRGIGSSTIADEARDRQMRQQQAAQAQTAMQGLQTVLPAYQQAYGNVFNQGMQGRTQSINEFLQFLDRQTAMDQWDKSYQNQTLSLMLNALGVGTVNPQMPQGGIPDPPAGAAESLGGIIGNVAPALPWDKWLT